MSAFWSNKRVVITGAAGFLGASVAGMLWHLECPYIRVCREDDYNLLDPDAVRSLYEDTHPNMVIHLPGRIGGAGGSCLPGSGPFYEAFMAATQVMELGRQYGLQKLVIMGAMDSDDPLVPAADPAGASEARMLADEAADLALGLLQVQTNSYRRHFGFNAVLLIPVDVYGPGDRFTHDTSHVIPRLIRACLEARDSGASQIILRNADAPCREFVYVEDAARAIVAAAEHYNGDQPLNLVHGQAITFRTLAELVAEETGFAGTLVWEAADRPGRRRPRLDLIDAARPAAGWATTSLVQGIRQTVSWFEAHREDLSETMFS